MTWTQAAHLFKPDDATSEQLSHFQGFPNPTLLESVGVPIPGIARLALREGQLLSNKIFYFFPLPQKRLLINNG